MRTLLILQLALAVLGPTAAGAQTATRPSVGDSAPDFALSSLDGSTVRLSDQLRRGPVVLVLLRGWPGYQCPFCTRQFADYLGHTDELQRAGARVVFVYPGPTDGLEEHAKAFLQARDMPAHFVFLIDPDYRFTQAYGLRWDAPGETAYPSTFIVDRKGIVRFANVSRGHGDRVPVGEVLEALGRR